MSGGEAPVGLAVAAALGVGLLAAFGRPALGVRFPRTVLALAGAVTALALAQLLSPQPPFTQVRLDPSSEPLLRRHHRMNEVYREALLSFGSDDIYVVAMETDDAFRREQLEALRRVTDGIRGLPGVRDAESLTNVLSFRWNASEQWAEVSKFIDDIPSDADALADLRRRALANRLYAKTLISADGRTAAVNVSFQPMTDGEFVDLDLDGRIRGLLERETDATRHFFVSGRPHVRSAAHHLMIRDVLTLIPLAIAAGIGVLWLISGSLAASLIPLGSCIVATLWSMAAMTALGIALNLITLVLAPMLICVGGVYGVHVFSRFEDLCLEQASSQDAALACVDYVRSPVLMAGFTTCVGFGALLLTDITAIDQFALFSILGVAAVTLLSLTAVPAALSLLPFEGGAAAAKAARPFFLTRTAYSARLTRGLEHTLAAIARLSARHSGAVLATSAALTLLSLAALPRIVVDTDFLSMFLENSDVRRDFERVNALMTGTVPVYVVLRGEPEVEGRFREPSALRTVERIGRELEALPAVNTVLSAVDLVSVVNRSLMEGDPAEERIPDSRAGLAEVFFTIPKNALRPFSTPNHASVNLIVRAGELGSAPLRRLEADIRAAAARETLPEGVTLAVTGNAILLNASADSIAGNQATMVVVAALTMFGLISLVFRSPRLGALAMVPNVLPVLLFFGMLGLGAAPLSLSTSMIGCVALGIAVDDTMHFLVGFRRRREAGVPTEEAVRLCVMGVGRPIIVTSVVLIVGFLVITAASFATLREFGALTAVTMGLCLFCDLILLPALLIRARA